MEGVRILHPVARHPKENMNPGDEHAGRRRLIPVLLASAFLISQCSLFDTRDPEQPSQSGSDFIPPTLVSDVVSNLKNAIAQKNIKNYLRSFTDSSVSGKPFTFTPSSTGSTSYPGVFGDWNLTREESHFRDLVSHKLSATSYSNLLLSGEAYNPQGDSTVYTASYIFSFDHNDPGFRNVARGRLQFTLKRNSSSFWEITDWTDYQEIDTVITWSHFKGRFR